MICSTQAPSSRGARRPGIVVSTGARTYFGKTTQLVQTARPALHVEEITTRVVRWLAGIVGISVIFAGTVSVLRGLDIIDILPLMLVLLVSAIPVALPAMFSISTALGSVALGRKGVLVTRLSASEDAGHDEYPLYRQNGGR